MPSVEPVLSKKNLVLLGVLLIVCCLTGCVGIGYSSDKMSITSSDAFVDSMGRSIKLDYSHYKTISLYSAHTENLYMIGAGQELVGVNSASIFPPEAALLPVIDYRGDPEPLIAMAPDIVLSRPYVDRNYPDYIKAIEKAGITVISLYPDDADSFDVYIEILGMVYKQQSSALSALKDYHSQLEAITKQTETLALDPVGVFFESSKMGYKTVTQESNPARAIEMAGGVNIASNVKPIQKGSTIAEYGIEKLMLQADEIDVYISQRGAMNSGGSLISIPQREGFYAIKAVADERILEMHQKLISAPTLRYPIGVMELARMFYPEVMDDTSHIISDGPMTRSAYCELLIKENHTPLFMPSSNLYYEKNHKVHTYGMFTDVGWYDDDFDYIETATIHSYIKGYKDENGKAYFDPEGYVTREMLAYSLYMIEDIQSVENPTTIVDLMDCQQQSIVQKVVDNGRMHLDDKGAFNPLEVVSAKRAREIIFGY